MSSNIQEMCSQCGLVGMPNIIHTADGTWCSAECFRKFHGLPAKPHYVKIRWGSAATRKENPDAVCGYGFNTEQELKAFMEGVDASSGWMDYEVVEDDDGK